MSGVDIGRVDIAGGIAFDALLDKLRGEGFAIGVDRVLLIERLLQGSGSRVAPPDLKHLLGPLLASTAEQQARFEVVYDEFFGLPNAERGLGRDHIQQPDPIYRRVDIRFAALVTVVLALMSVPARVPEVEPPPMPAAPRAYERPVALPRARSSIAGQPVTLSSASSTSFQNLPLSARWTLSSRPAGSRARLDPTNSFVADQPGDYTVTLTVHDGVSASQPAALAVGVPKEPPSPPPPAPKIGIRWDRRVDEWIIDFRWAWWLLPPAGAALAFLFRRYWNRRKIIDRTRKDDFTRRHKIHELTLAEDPGAVADIRTAIQALRRPFEGTPKLDIPKSVVATAKAGLYPTEFRSPTRRRAEYLILIDTLSTRDHQSTHFQRMVVEMHKSGLQVDAYLYSGDPRVCRPMPGVTRGTNNVLLADLVHKAAGARLLILGDGSRLLYEQSPELQPWTEVFHQWPERAIMTPKRADGEWSFAEEALAKRFLLLETTPESFKHFLDHRKTESSFEFSEPGWQYATADELKDALGDRVYRWLSACALYPRLEWILTQRLGRELGLYSDEGLLRLIRLPWFRRGEMPVELQEDLVDRMTAADRRQARAAMIRLLDEAKAKGEGTPGAGLEIAVQQLDFTPKERQQLKRDMAVARDAAKSDKNWLVRLPERLRSLLFSDSSLLAARSRPMLYLLGVIVLLAGVGALGKQGFVEIAQRYIGPTVPGRLPFRLDEPIRLVRFSGDGQRVVAVGDSGPGVWSNSGEWVADIAYTATPKEMVVSGDGTLVTVGGNAGICTMRVDGAGGCIAKIESGELLGAEARRGLVAVGISNSTLNSQDTLKEVAQFPARNVQRVLWSGDDSGWFQVGRGVQQFRLQGGRIETTRLVAGSGKLGLNWRGEPVFGWDAVAAGLSVSVQRTSVLIATLVGGYSERKDFSSRVTAVVFDPVSNRIAIGLEEGRIEFLEGRLSNRVNPADGLEYVWIPPGRFLMGCSPGDNQCEDDEKSAHPVEITRGFWMGRTEVTQAAYRKVIGDNPSNFKGDTRPVESVSWAQVEAYCKKVGMRLPTEAEWEYAARAGNPAARYGALDAIAWYGKGTEIGTQGVGLLRPNAWGLYDMLGNVWEWVSDRYGPYSAGLATDPAGPTSGQFHAVRGGGWCCEIKDSSYVRAPDRAGVENGSSDNGFRCAGELR